MKIILSIAVVLMFISCSDEKSSSSEKKIAESATKIVETVSEESKKIVEEVTVVAQETANDVTTKIDKQSDKVVENTKEVIRESTKTINDAIAIPLATIDGSKLFTKCATCHGQNGENKALNKSQVIKGWDVDKLKIAINGYKDGSYGSTMKGVMKGYVQNLNEDEIEALSEYISKL